MGIDYISFFLLLDIVYAILCFVYSVYYGNKLKSQVGFDDFSLVVEKS